MTLNKYCITFVLSFKQLLIMAIYTTAIGFSNHFLNTKDFLRDNSRTLKFPLKLKVFDDPHDFNNNNCVIVHSEELNLTFYPERFVFKNKFKNT